MTQINIAEILKDCPKGTKLYSPLCGDCRLIKIYDGLGFDVINDTDDVFNFSYDGRYNLNGECCIFPSKKNRDWNTFRPFNDGDIIANDNFIVIFSHSKQSEVKVKEQVMYYHCYLGGLSCFNPTKGYGVGYISDFRFATDEEKQKLFDVIKANGYNWNAETKTLEKLIVPKFKVGDRIKLNNSRFIYTITDLLKDRYRVTTDSCDLYEIEFERQDAYRLVPNHKFKVGDIIKAKNPSFVYKIINITDTHYTLESMPGKHRHNILICEDEDWELTSNKFDILTLKPFDTVLVRDDNNSKWVNTFFGFYDTVTNQKYPFIAGSVNWAQCIPYESNEYLLGTCDDCDEYYKNW